MCFFPLNLLSTAFSPTKLPGLTVNASHPNVLYASSNVLIVPLLLPLMFFGFLTYQPIAFFSTPNTQIFIFLPSTLFLLPLVGKISIAFSPNNPLFLLFLLKIFRTIFTTRFSIRTNRSSSYTLPVSSPTSVSHSHFFPITFTDLITISKLYLHLPAPLTLFLQKALMNFPFPSFPSFSILLTFF